MDKNEIKEKIKKAIEQLFNNQPNIFEFTSETSQTEWNLACHLAHEVKNIFSEYDCDNDVTKRNYKNKRPDIIVHKRGTNEANLVVIEVKRDLSNISLDIEKIKDDWFRPPLSYDFGAIVVINNNKEYCIKVFENLKSNQGRTLPVD